VAVPKALSYTELHDEANDQYLRIKALEAVLAWYADEDHYTTSHRPGWVNADRGMRAREVLEKTKGLGGPKNDNKSTT